MYKSLFFMSEFSKKLKNEYNRARKAVLNANKTPLIGLCLSGVLLYMIVILLLTSKVIFVLIP